MKISGRFVAQVAGERDQAIALLAETWNKLAPVLLWAKDLDQCPPELEQLLGVQEQVEEFLG